MISLYLPCAICFSTPSFLYTLDSDSSSERNHPMAYCCFVRQRAFSPCPALCFGTSAIPLYQSAYIPTPIPLIHLFREIFHFSALTLQLHSFLASYNHLFLKSYSDISVFVPTCGGSWELARALWYHRLHPLIISRFLALLLT